MQNRPWPCSRSLAVDVSGPGYLLDQINFFEDFLLNSKGYPAFLGSQFKLQNSYFPQKGECESIKGHKGEKKKHKNAGHARSLLTTISDGKFQIPFEQSALGQVL